MNNAPPELLQMQLRFGATCATIWLPFVVSYDVANCHMFPSSIVKPDVGVRSVMTLVLYPPSI